MHTAVGERRAKRRTEPLHRGGEATRIDGIGDVIEPHGGIVSDRVPVTRPGVATARAAAGADCRYESWNSTSIVRKPSDCSIPVSIALVLVSARSTSPLSAAAAWILSAPST